MKACKICGTSDPADFYETQRSHYCRPCWTSRYIQAGRDRLFQAKTARGECVDCHLKVTEQNACAFDWDHLGDKRWNVSMMMSCSLSSFNTEIAKCELVCSNCHRIRTKTRGRTWAKGGRPRKVNHHASPPTPPDSP
jgi:hypothetical protein